MEVTHALYINDNFDGENDKYWIFAYEKDGVFYSYGSINPILQHEGDEILKTVKLD